MPCVGLRTSKILDAAKLAKDLGAGAEDSRIPLHLQYSFLIQVHDTTIVRDEPKPALSNEV